MRTFSRAQVLRIHFAVSPLIDGGHFMKLSAFVFFLGLFGALGANSFEEIDGSYQNKQFNGEVVVFSRGEPFCSENFFQVNKREFCMPVEKFGAAFEVNPDYRRYSKNISTSEGAEHLSKLLKVKFAAKETSEEDKSEIRKMLAELRLKFPQKMEDLKVTPETALK